MQRFNRNVYVGALNTYFEKLLICSYANQCFLHVATYGLETMTLIKQRASMFKSNTDNNGTLYAWSFLKLEDSKRENSTKNKVDIRN